MKTKTHQIFFDSRLKNLKFEINRSKGHLFSYINNRIRWHLFPTIHHVAKFPSHVDIELSSLCNLNCPMCYTTTDNFKAKVNQKVMNMDLFKKIIDECSKFNLYSIRLSLRGESFINKDIFKMIEYAKKKGIKEVSTLTHGGFLNEEKFEKLIDLDLDWLSISFDGIEDTYNKIRHPLKFEDSLENIKNYQKIKKRRGVVKPVIKVQTVWPAISKDPDRYFSLFEPITDQVASNPLIDYLAKDSDIEYEENFSCPQLYQRFVIGADGNVMLCAFDEMESHKIGNMNNETIFDIWHGEKINKAREIHKKHLGAEQIEICKHCPLTRKRESESTNLGGKSLKISKYVGRDQTVGK